MLTNPCYHGFEVADSGRSPRYVSRQSQLRRQGFSCALSVDGKCSIPASIRLARFNSQIPAFLRRCFAAYRGNLRSPRRSTAREVARKYWQPGVERLEGDCVSRVDPVVESGQARSINDFAPVEWSSDDSGFHRQEEPKPDSSGGVFLSPDPLRI